MLYNGGAKKCMSIHQLVAMSFLGHSPDGTHKVVVDHVNDDKIDNRVKNLQLLSNRENCNKRDSKGKSKSLVILTILLM